MIAIIKIAIAAYMVWFGVTIGAVFLTGFGVLAPGATEKVEKYLKMSLKAIGVGFAAAIMVIAALLAVGMLVTI